MAAPLNLKRVEAFLAVAQARSISRAAAQLEVAQSVVSRHIAGFEADLGYRLFERTGRGVSLTAAAQQLAPRLRSAMQEMERAAIEAAELDQPHGEVRVGLVPSAARPLAGLLYQRIGARFPKIRLQFFEGFSNALEDRISAGDLDLAVFNRYGRLLHHDEERLCVVDSLVVGPAGALDHVHGAVPFRALAELHLVLAARPNGLRVALDQLCKRNGVALQIAVEADSLSTMKDLILQGGLYTVLPHQVLHDELEAGVMSAARLMRPAIRRTLSLATARSRPGSAAMRVVGREIRDIVQTPAVRAVWR